MKIQLSYEVASHYGFEYLWNTWHQDPSEPLVLEGGRIDEETGMLGSILIKVEAIKGTKDMRGILG